MHNKGNCSLRLGRHYKFQLQLHQWGQSWVTETSSVGMAVESAGGKNGNNFRIDAGIKLGKKNTIPRIPTTRIASNTPTKERLLRRSRSSCFLRGETKGYSSGGVE